MKTIEHRNLQLSLCYNTKHKYFSHTKSKVLNMSTIGCTAYVCTVVKLVPILYIYEHVCMRVCLHPLLPRLLLCASSYAYLRISPATLTELKIRITADVEAVDAGCLLYTSDAADERSSVD